MDSYCINKENLYKHLSRAFLCLTLLLSVFSVTTFAAVIQNEGPGCNADDLIGQSVVNKQCSSATGSNGCPTDDFVCCPSTYTFGALSGNYDTINNTNAVCTSGTIVHSQTVPDGSFSQWGWLEIVNGGWTSGFLDTAVSPCSDGDSTYITGGGPNYNSLCDAGYRLFARSSSTTNDEFDFYCAYGKEITVDGGTLPACVAYLGEACTNTPAPPVGDPGTVACADVVVGTEPNVACRYVSPTSDTGTCALCAGSNPTSTPECLAGDSPSCLPAICDPDQGVFCCDTNAATPDMQCEAVFTQDLVLPGIPGGMSNKGCVLPVEEETNPAFQCAGVGGTGAFCWLDSGAQCASGICSDSDPIIKKCVPSPEYSECGVDGDCFCNTAAGQFCIEEEIHPGLFTCRACIDPGPAPYGSASCIPGVDCCQTRDGLGFICDPNVSGGTCMPQGACIADNELCASETDICCDNINRSCQEEAVPNVFNCLLNPQCTATVGQTCLTISDCCPSTNPTWACEPDVNGELKCTDTPTQGTSCTGTGCCDGNPGYICQNGSCVASDICDPTVEENPYTGPIVSFDDLLARIYSLLYPLGIFVGIILIIKSGYTLMTSEGNPQKVKQGQEELTSAILGVFFILLSIVIIRVIIKSILGVDL